MCDMDELIEIWRKVEDHIDGLVVIVVLTSCFFGELSNV